MKQFILALMASVATLTTLAQNLVPNPSFEEYLECPFSTAELENQVVDWYSWQESPDFFHVCSNDIEGFAGVPENAWGYQLPITGDGYSGIFTYVDFVPNGREYIAAPLQSPLEVGENYYLMFHTSLCDGGLNTTRKCANNNIGMRFFKDPTYSSFPPDQAFNPDNFAHLNSNDIIEDDTNWVKIDGWFTADDAYNWVALGNFFDDQNTSTLVLNEEESCWGVYYIENLCVAKDPTECDYLLGNGAGQTGKNFPIIYPNPANHMLQVEMNQGYIENGTMYDLQGKVVLNKIAISNPILSIDVSILPKGFYVLRIQSNSQIFNHKIIIE